MQPLQQPEVDALLGVPPVAASPDGEPAEPRVPALRNLIDKTMTGAAVVGAGALGIGKALGNVRVTMPVQVISD